MSHSGRIACTFALAVAAAFGAAQVSSGPAHGVSGTTIRHPGPTPGGTWTPLANTSPAPYLGIPLLLTDGTVIFQVPNGSDWYKLTPDINGSYINGTWSQIASFDPSYAPLYFASAVLADGRVFTMGGEYNGPNQDWTNLGAIYDPVANTWTSLAAPSGWDNIGDAQCAVSPTGKLILANPFDTRMASFDPATMTWTALNGTGKADRFDEEGWSLLPDGTILTVDALNSPNSERYSITQDLWSSMGSVPQALEDTNSQELGPMVLRPDGTIFAMGATGHNAIFNPTTNTWTSAPDFPIVSGGQLDIADGPACLLPDGNVLCAASPGVFNSPVDFFEFDGTNLTQVAATPNAPGDSSYVGNMIMLPSGQVLFTDFSNDIEIYTPYTSTFNAAWQPTVSSVASTVQEAGANYLLQGTQLNGLSQCSAYGDDSTNATNYPLVKIVNAATGHVFFARTHNHSSMGVATGSATVSTKFDVSMATEIGPSTLYVVTNGIPSAGTAVNVVAPNVVLPSSESLYRGTAVSGSLSSLFYADSSSLITGIGPTLNRSEAPVQVLVNGTSTVTSPSSTFSLTVRGHASSTNVTETVYLYNYSTNAFVAFGSLPLTTSDQTLTVSAPAGTLSQYVNPTTGAIEAKVAATQVGATLQSHWTVSLNQVNWTIN